MTSALSRDLIFLIMQFLDDEQFKETAHRLELESGLFFNLKYFEDIVMNGNWDEVEKYLSGFTRAEDNRYSMKIYFEIRKQKYLEALDQHDRAKAVEILMNDLKVFAAFNEELFKEITQLLTLDNFRENDQLSGYIDARTARTVMFAELKRLIEANPLLHKKLQFPKIKGSRLRMLINQSLNWQHSLCGNPRQNPDIKSLFFDHTCRNPTDAYAQLGTGNQLMQGFIPLGPNGPFPPISGPIQTHSVIPPAGLGYGNLNPGIPSMSNGPGDTDVPKPLVSGMSGRIMLKGSNSNQNLQNSVLTDELPKTVARTLNQNSVPTTMDFHPIQQTLLLVGTGIGDISLWEVSSREKIGSKNFQVWDIGAMSLLLKASLMKDPCVSVKRILWSPDGSLFGVAYSKHIVQLYTYHGGPDIRNHLEIDAHRGSTNDIAFSNAPKKLCIISCGDDKTIKVWDAATGSKLFTFEGHDSPVFSICPHSLENVHFLFSTSVNGKIKAWLYDSAGSRVDYDAPGHSCTTMVYSGDGKRLFSCGTSQEGESHMVEWNENEGTIKRTYQGLLKRSTGVVQFDTSKSKFLAAGDDHCIKFWDMDSPNLLSTVNPEGGLLAIPRIRFNKEGTLLAVSANDNKIKILATTDGLRLMRTFESCSLVSSRVGVAPDTPTENGDTIKLEEMKPRLSEELNHAKTCKFTEISEPSQLQSLRLLAHVKIDEIARLVYTNSGTAILALSFNAIHTLWKWPRSDTHVHVKATTKVNPLFVQQTSGLLMTNDLTGDKPDEAIMPCFALSKNDSYVMSASGGKISLFNTLTFKTMATFMAPPPAATYLAFHPQDNNIIAVGMDDATISIYNVRMDEVKSKLKGHSKKITGLAFSQTLNTLVSTGADAQIISWNSDSWERQKNSFLQVPAGRTPASAAVSNTHIHFHKDQIHFLIVRETHIAIYEATKLRSVNQWNIAEYSAPISCATFSCDSQLVYCSFHDGTIRVFNAPNLDVRCQINPSSYLPSDVSSTVYPFSLAAHPQESNQFAIGLTNGEILMFEPLESDGMWGHAVPSAENAPRSSIPPASGNGASDKMQS